MAKDYEIGFKKPPKKTQFKKGATGNPKGRPKEVKNLKSVVRDEAYSKVVIKEDGKTRTVTKLEALIKRTMAKGLQGDNKAASTALALLQEYLPHIDPEAARRVPLSEQDLKILSNHADFLEIMKGDSDDEDDT